MNRVLEKDESGTIGFGGGIGWSTAQTTLLWRIVSDDINATGELAWPFSNDPAERHGVGLLTVAEDGWRDGCPNARPIQFAGLGAWVNKHDSDPDRFDDTLEILRERILSWRPELCAAR